MSGPRDEPLPPAFQRIRRLRLVGGAVGALLLVAAIAVVANSGAALDAVWAALGRATPLEVALLAGSVLASVVCTGTVFFLLTRRFGRVGFGEMQALLAATTLANYLPLRPGLVGRVLWHRSRNDIRPVDALRTMIEAMALSGLALAAVVPALLVGARSESGLAVALAAPAAAGALGLLFGRTRTLALAWIIRYGETLLTALRYHLAFGLVGAPIAPESSVAIACVSMIASLVPFVSNGLGLREWAIGLLAPLLGGATLEQGIAAELVNRAVEIAIVIPTGLLGAWFLYRSGLRKPPRPDPAP